MKFFLDTANLDDIRFWKKYNLVDGVTTNPTLLSKEKLSPTKQIEKNFKIISGPVSSTGYKKHS